MVKPSYRPIDIYSELCPASSAAIIGAGLVTVTMGVTGEGLAVVVAGIVVGVVAPLTKGFTLQSVGPQKK